MKNTKTRALAVVLLVFGLIAAVLMCTSCAPRKTGTGATIVATQELGSGSKTITFLAVDGENRATEFILHTDKTTLADALLEHGLIAGNDGPYGLMVDTVNGIRADYSANSSWWCLYEGDTMCSVGVSALNITDGGTYAFIYTIG